MSSRLLQEEYTIHVAQMSLDDCRCGGYTADLLKFPTPRAPAARPTTSSIFCIFWRCASSARPWPLVALLPGCCFHQSCLVYDCGVSVWLLLQVISRAMGHGHEAKVAAEYPPLLSFDGLMQHYTWRGALHLFMAACGAACILVGVPSILYAIWPSYLALIGNSVNPKWAFGRCSAALITAIWCTHCYKAQLFPQVAGLI